MPPESAPRSAPDLPDVSHETRARLDRYCLLLQKWQAAINLVSPATLPHARTRHFDDSLQLLPLIPVDAERLYDLGSGAGFPGLVLAMARPDLAVTLVESDQKKASFLSAVSRETECAVTVANERIEVATATRPAPDVITARALASLPDLLGLCAPWIAANPDIVLVFPKGARAAAEIEAARAGWDFALESWESATDSSARILVLTRVRAKST